MDAPQQGELGGRSRHRSPGRARVVWHEVCWWGSWVLIGVVFTSIRTGALHSNRLFHVGPLLVQTWVADGLLSWLVFVCWFVVLLTMPAAPSDQTRIRRALRVASRAVAGLLAAAVALIWVLYAPWIALDFGRTHYRVLSPASPGGCRLVGEVTRDSYSAGSAGRIYLALPRSTMVQETGSGWHLPGSIDPFRDRAWSLRWEGKVGYLTVNGADYDSLPANSPYRPPTGTFTCPR